MILAGILDSRTADDVLRAAFPEAQRREMPLRVLLAGAAAAPEQTGVRETVERWSGKYPGVACAVTAHPGLDAAITLAAGARRCVLVMTAEPAGARDAAVLRAVRRRLPCPLTTVAAGAARPGTAGPPAVPEALSGPDSREGNDGRRPRWNRTSRARWRS
ncbi:hypothetical protein [Paractinoplanes deccanensis]|nr:hypothetical protein [Actinoplanes deccanensis]